MVVVEVLLVLAVLAAIGYPLFIQPKTAIGPEEGDEYHRLLAAKETAFVTLKDLEFDYKTGKMDDEDYHKLKAQYEAEAVAVLKQMDGASAAPRQKTGKQKEQFCAACGAKAAPDARFCAACGKPLKK